MGGGGKSYNESIMKGWVGKNPLPSPWRRDFPDGPVAKTPSAQ